MVSFSSEKASLREMHCQLLCERESRKNGSLLVGYVLFDLSCVKLDKRREKQSKQKNKSGRAKHCRTSNQTARFV
jgi:hypothetical protein